MIIRSEPDRLRVTSQLDHAILAGQFAAAWGGNGFSRPEPADVVQLAASIHDEGWDLWEGAPHVNPANGCPYSFTDLPTDQHLEIYTRCIGLAALRHPYAGLLVSMHGTGLYRQRYGHMPGLTHKPVRPEFQPLVDRFLIEQEALQARLREQLEPPPQTLWTHYRWLQVWDGMSVFLGLTDPAECREFSFGPVPVAPGGAEPVMTVAGTGPGTATVSPWPFEPGRVVAEMPVRFLPDRPYRDDDDFRATFAAAPVERLTIALSA